MTKYDPITLANAFIQAGELDDALDALNQHIEANSEDDTARRLRVQVLMRMQGEIRWQTIMEDSLALKLPNADDHLRMSILSERLNDLDSAVYFTDEALRLQPDDKSIIERHIRLALAHDDDSLPLDQFLEQLPRHWRWLGWRGEVAALRGNNESAIKSYSDALAHLESTTDTVNDAFAANQKAQILLKRASIYQRQNALSEADTDYVAAEQIIPNDPLIPFNRGLIAVLQGDVERGVELCRNAFSSSPDALRDEMHKALEDQARYAPIAAALQA